MSNRGMDKEDMLCVCVCMYMYIYIKWNITQPSKRMKYCIAPVWMDLESVKLNGVSQTEKEKYSMASLMCGI